MPAPIPNKDQLEVLFGHIAYRLGDAFSRRKTGIRHRQVWTADEFRKLAPAADVAICSGFWRNEILDGTPRRLRFVQSCSAGTDQYDKAKFRTTGVRLANAFGVNERAVAEHAIALILALARKLPEGRDNQMKRQWRGMISDPNAREDELGGKTLLIVGMGRIGGRLSQLAKAFDMKVIATKRDTGTGRAAADEVHGQDRLAELLPRADFVALTCPLTPETENLVNSRTLALLKPTAALVNVARGKVVDEGALIAALAAGRLAGAALDVTREEPLPAASPLWALPNVFITPHTGGETSQYEERVVDCLLDNLDRLWKGETRLRNEVV